MGTLRCLVLSKDKAIMPILRATLKEYCLKFREVPSLEMLGPLSTGATTLGWFIDLDAVTQSVSQIVKMAKRVAPEAKVVFLSSFFTRELAQECLEQNSAGLLLKPLVVPRLVQIVNFLRQEPELFDRDDLIPTDPESNKDLELPSENELFRAYSYSCQMCGNKFTAIRMKAWIVPSLDIETDFCPVCPNEVFPELYSIMVCPECYYSTYVGRFERYPVDRGVAMDFLQTEKVFTRKTMARGMIFQGRRTFLHGIVGLELAVHCCLDLQLPDSGYLAGEYFLKMSWLCRRMGKGLQEQEAQIRAVDHFMKIYRPYLQKNGKFPSRQEIQDRLGPNENPLRERGIVVVGFLIADLSRRLSLFEQAEFYFDEVLKIPFLPNFTTLYRHIVKVRDIMRKQPGAK